MKLVAALYPLIALLLAGCFSQPDKQTEASRKGALQTNTVVTAQPTETSVIDEWIGVYSSPSEIEGFTGTVLVVEKGLHDDLDYRKTFHSDVVSADAIEQDIRSGNCLIEGNRIYIPEAYGYFREGKPNLLASIQRYTKVTINGHVTLMRDDAYGAFKSENKLYDYGILIKVSSKADDSFEFDKVEHKSITVLYSDKTKQWKDPFVNGPNQR